MRAYKWRQKLLGSRVSQTRISKINLDIDLKSEDDKQIHHDVYRSNIDSHHEKIEHILNVYSFINKGMGYSQGFNMLAIPLWTVFYKSAPKTSIADTFFALHIVIDMVRPLYPLHEKDKSPVEYASYLAKIIKLRLRDIEFTDETTLLLNVFIISKVPV